MERNHRRFFFKEDGDPVLDHVALVPQPGRTDSGSGVLAAALENRFAGN